MNLKEFLNYRTNCIFCQEELTLCPSPVLSINYTQDGLSLTDHLNLVALNYDYSVVKETNYPFSERTIYLTKLCTKCFPSVRGNELNLNKGGLLSVNYSYCCRIKINGNNFKLNNFMEYIYWKEDKIYCSSTSIENDGISIIKLTSGSYELPIIYSSGLNFLEYLERIKLGLVLS